jgi:hypothetical protein
MHERRIETKAGVSNAFWLVGIRADPTSPVPIGPQLAEYSTNNLPGIMARREAVLDTPNVGAGEKATALETSRNADRSFIAL